MDGSIRILNVIDEFTHECRRSGRPLLTNIVIMLSMFCPISSSADVASLAASSPTMGRVCDRKLLKEWICAAVRPRLAYITRPGRMVASGLQRTPARYELLDGEIFYTLRGPKSSSKVGGATSTQSIL